MGKSEVKCTLVQALRLCTGCTAHRESRGIALLFLDHGTRRGWGISVTPRPLFTSGKDPVPIVEEAGWAPGPVWTGAENLAPTLIRSPDCPARSQSLYWLCYPAHVWRWTVNFTRTNIAVRAFYLRGFGFSFRPKGQLSWLWFFCGFPQPLLWNFTLEYTVVWYWQGRPSVLGGKTCPIATLSTINSTWMDLGLNQGLFGFRLVTNHLLHFLDILLTVHLSIILVTDQPNTQIPVL